MTYNPKLITLSALLTAMIPLLYLIGHGQFMYAFIIVGVVIFLTINRNLEMWWMIAIAMQANGLNLGLPSSIDWSFMSMWAFVGFSVLTRAILVKDKTKLVSVRRTALGLLLVTFVTASIRGWGLRILGSEKWGGMQYLFPEPATVGKTDQEDYQLAFYPHVPSGGCVYYCPLYSAVGFSG